MGYYAKIGAAPLLLVALLGAAGMGSAAPGQQRVEAVQPRPTPKFIPPKVCAGDDEFNGHGPHVRVRVELFVRNGQLWAYVWMDAIELCADWTQANGWTEYMIFAPSEGRVVGFAQGQATVSDLDYTDTNHEDDVFTRGPQDPVLVYTASGDRRGSDAGVHTGVQLEFNRIRVVIE
jgi:hypothetical protein